MSNTISKIEYHSLEKCFYLTKPTFPFLEQKKVVIPQQNLLYTSDPELNKIFINLVDLRDLSTYGAIFKEGWLQTQLFAELVNEKQISIRNFKKLNSYKAKF